MRNNLHTRKACLLLILIVAVSIAVGFASNSEAALPAIWLGQGELQSDGNISFPLQLSDSQGSAIASMELHIKFQSETLQLIRSAGAVLSAVAGKSTIDAGKQLNQSENLDGVLTLVVAGGTSVLADGELAHIVFKVVGKDPFIAPFSLDASVSDKFAVPVSVRQRIMGDVLGKGQTPQLSDALLLMYASIGAYHLSLTQFSYSDMNSDGKVNMADAILVLAKVTGL